MPLLILHPVPPLPPLPTYFALSFLLLLWSVLQAREELSVLEQSGITTAPPSEMDPSSQTLNLTHYFDIQEDDITVLKYVKSMVRDSWSVLVLCNVAFCFLLVVGMGLQWLIFGKLRDIERQHVRDKLWNFAFYKFIVVFGVLNVQTLEEMVFWVAWFATFAFLHAFAQLSKDRFEYLSFSPATPNTTHAKVLGLLASIFSASIILGCLCGYVGNSHGWNLFLFMIAECLLLAFRTLHVILKYAIHLYDLHYEGVWEKRGMVVYYTELFMELLVLGVDFTHHIHMLLWGNVFLSMASLVICLQIRFLYNEIQRRVQRHRNYRKVVHNMEARFANASDEELRQNDDDCAICWEEMKSARKLPCNHLFHDGCLRSWLEHETSCPTCRQPLNITRTEGGSRPQPAGEAAPQGPTLTPAQRIGARNPTMRNRLGGHFFHFDGSMIASWMPSFSVEVTHSNVLRRRMAANRISVLNNMANQVTQMFPHISHSAALNDLRMTRSVELTVANIVEGRLVDTGTPPGSPASSEPPSSPEVPASPEIEEADTYSPLLRSPDSASNTASSPPTDAETPWDQPSTSSAWHQVSEGGDTGHSFSDTGARFSKSSTERQNMLQLRKERLLLEARRKYANNQAASSRSDTRNEAIGQHQTGPSTSSPSSSSSEGNLQEHTSLPPSVTSNLHSESDSNYDSSSPGTLYTSEAGPRSDDVVRRRNAVLEATLRRLNQQQL